jgi:hypothetical protein
MIRKKPTVSKSILSVKNIGSVENVFRRGQNRKDKSIENITSKSDKTSVTYLRSKLKAKDYIIHTYSSYGIKMRFVPNKKSGFYFDKNLFEFRKRK